MDRVWKVMDDAPPRPRPRSERLAPYAGGAALAGLGFLANFGFVAPLDGRVFVLFFVPAVLVGSVVGGFLAGLFAAAVSLMGLAVLVGSRPFDAPTAADVGLFALLALVIAVGGERLRRGRLQASEMTRSVQEREAYLQSVLNTVPDAMIVTDAKGLIQSFSPAAERAFGYTAHEVRGRNVALLMPSPDRTRHDDYLDHYARTGERKIIGVGRIVTAARKNGETFPVELSVGQADSGSHRFFTGFIRDLTRQEADKLRLQELQAELLQISRLSAMGEMAAALAHELNQPLSAIANYLNVAQLLLRSENAGSEAIKPMGKAAEQTLRAGDIIRRLREFIAGGGPERSVESLSKVIQEAASLALTGARERGVRVEIAEDDAADRVLIDKVQVQQVVVNLVRNALEAMETSPRRELRITTRAHSEAFAQVTVADTGSGISETVASRLFQPFVTTKGGLGMGVGLSICRTIIEAQGGRIWTEPAPGGGAQFSFTLPRVMEEELVS